MNFPPMIMRVIVDKEDQYVNLWVPLFLIAPICLIFMFAFFVVMLPFALLATILMWRWDWWRPIFYFWPSVLRVFSALRGLEVDVDNEDQVYIAFK